MESTNTHFYRTCRSTVRREVVSKPYHGLPAHAACHSNSQSRGSSTWPRWPWHVVIQLPLVLLAITLCGRPCHSEQPRPNILIVLADDLGYSDLGCYGSEIRTPNLDAMAMRGLRLTQFYNTARCWPTRAALLTGYYAQQVRRDVLESIPSGNRGERPEWAPLVCRMLNESGYRCYHSGKWHIDGMPVQNGFEHSYYLQDQGRFFSPRKHFQDDQPLEAVKPGGNYYGTVAITNHCVETLQEHLKSHADQPFFHYLAYTAPHFPLQALPEDIARYQSVYAVGWDAIRQQRFEKQQQMGLLPGVALSAVETEVGPPYDFPEALPMLGPGEVNRPVKWASLTDEQRQFQASKMAIHAAMVDRIDQELGRVFELLASSGKLDNTLIFFLSDNGASAEMMVRDDGHDPGALPGSAKSYLCLGPGWSTVCNTPFRRHKTWVHEGGISTPLIVSWPGQIAARGELRHASGHVIDIVPTVLDVACVDPPTFENAPAYPGRSLRPVFSSDAKASERNLWWQHEGNRAFREGNWKIVAAGKEAAWELYDMGTDRAEAHNLAAERPEVVEELSRKWSSQLQEFRQRFE